MRRFSVLFILLVCCFLCPACRGGDGEVSVKAGGRALAAKQPVDEQPANEQPTNEQPAKTADKNIEKAKPVVWRTDLSLALAEGRRAGRPLLIDAWAPWCAVSLDLKKRTLVDSQVLEALGSFIPVSLDMDAEENEAVWERYQIRGLPWIAVVRPDGTVVPESILTDFEDAEHFRARLRRALDVMEESGDDQSP